MLSIKNNSCINVNDKRKLAKTKLGIGLHIRIISHLNTLERKEEYEKRLTELLQITETMGL
jgi:hypothetical protein